jgi:hypothetical protein
VVVVSIIIPDVHGCRGTMLAPIRHVTNKSETKEFIRTEMRQFEVRWVNVKTN